MSPTEWQREAVPRRFDIPGLTGVDVDDLAGVDVEDMVDTGTTWVPEATP